MGNNNAAGSRGGIKRGSPRKKPFRIKPLSPRERLGMAKIRAAHVKSTLTKIRKDAKLSAWRKKHSSFG